MILDGIRDGHEEEPPDIFNLVAVLILAVATSIDALAVGLSFALLHITLSYPGVYNRPDIRDFFDRWHIFRRKSRSSDRKADRSARRMHPDSYRCPDSTGTYDMEWKWCVILSLPENIMRGAEKIPLSTR
jgi:hypothetical protein